MKKFLFISIVALLAASCSNDDEPVITETKYVKAEMKVSAGQTATSRAYLGHIDDDHGSKTIGVKFTRGDKMDIYESCSYQQNTKYVFTNQDQGAYQAANFSGTWTTDEGAWAAIFPSSPSNKMTLLSNDANGTGTNIYESVIPQDQTTIGSADGGVTYDNAANIMVAARYKKEVVETPTCFLAPIVCYLYFASRNETVNIVSTAGSISGAVKCTTSKNTWANWENFDGCATISGTDASAKTITSHGLYMERSKKYEHIVCMIPGTFEKGQLTIGSLQNNLKQDLKHVHMYYLGAID
ncbi:MAG: hypothetical protein MJZ29_03660 [Bacteroidaceae bacterium]|nr:hypothetical protein [Bacteroidaceae bacterium]